MSEETAKKELALESVITAAIQIPGVKVNRSKFLAELFATEEVAIQEVLDHGPISAGVSQKRIDVIADKHILKRTSQSSFLAELFATEEVAIQEVLDHGPISAGVSQKRIDVIADKHILKRTSQSSAASFVAGIPGGLAMAATVPADVMQFFGMALRLAQELSYLYGAQDLWQGGQVDDEKVQSQLLLYCGVMFGVSGAVSGVRVLSAQIAKTTIKKLPQKALTKTFWFPMVKQIGKAVGIKVTKSSVAKGVSKAVPVLGGVISGGLNFASMMPMAHRLKDALDSAAFGYTQEEFEKDIIEIETFAEQETEGGLNFASMMPMAHRLKDALDSAAFGYTQEEFEKDIIEIETFAEQETEIPQEAESAKKKMEEGGKKAKDRISDFFSRKKQKDTPKENETPIELIKKLADLRDAGIISDEEFEQKKSELLSKI